MADVLNRRAFLVYGGATAAGITLGQAGRRWLARADAHASTWHPAAVETFASSVCRECPAGCGIRVRLMDDVPVKLEGNPNCPVSRGRLCAKGQAALESYFDPDRLVGPARRSGPRGSGRWTPVSWDEGIGTLASQLKQARGDALAFSADERGPIDRAWVTFWTSRQARIVRTLPATADRFRTGFAGMTGATGTPLFDLEHATHVLSFGAPIVEDWLSPLWAQRSYGEFRRGGGRSRGRLVQVDARRSLTARKADEWLPVPVDRQAALAYGIACVLLRENRIDRDALRDRGGNLDHFESVLNARLTPDEVAAATGIPVVTLLRIARDLTATSQPLVVTATDAPPGLVDAVFALNALIGALDRPGGVFEVPRRAEPADQASAALTLADMTAERSKAGLIAFRDPSALRDPSAPARIVPIFESARFIVSFSPYLDETASVADLLLPTHTPLESWHGVVPAPSDGAEKLACARPAASVRLNTADLLTVLHGAASQIGPAIASEMPASSGEAVQAEIDRAFASRRGTPYVGAFETNWMQQLERGGWWVPAVPTRQAFARQVLEAGGWVDPYFDRGELRRSILRHGGLRFPEPVQPSEVSLADTPPAVVTARELLVGNRNAERTAALRLVTFTPAAVNLAGGPNQPVLFELLGQPDGQPWRVWAEIGSETARQLGIDHGATVRISSASGSIDVAASVVERTPPGTVAVAYVPAVASAGRWARLVAADVRKLWHGGAPNGPLTVTVTPV